jgi:membrane fusion protein (multidrug efflux system)
MNTMKKITQIGMFSFILFLAACSSKKDNDATNTDKKAKLEKLKSEIATKTDEAKKLEDELLLTDSATANAAKIKLVAVAPVTIQDFSHYLDLQGKVDAENISYITPRGQPGVVKAVYVQQGQQVRKGQLLLKMDDAVLRQQLLAAQQQSGSIKADLALAKNIYARQKNLWDQGIGTQVELLQDQAKVQNLESQLASSGQSANVAAEQLNTTNVYSDVNGIADIVNIKPGETFTGNVPGANTPQIKIVNTSSLKVVTSIPENYTTVVHTGSPAEITVTDINKVINAPVSLVSQSVDPSMRGFVAEIKIPYDAQLKPNQSAKVRILDYRALKTVVIPVSTVQSDETGKYVYVLEKMSNGKSVARKKVITLGQVYGNNAEIKTGLSANELLITEGFQSLYEGQGVTTEVK